MLPVLCVGAYISGLRHCGCVGRRCAVPTYKQKSRYISASAKNDHDLTGVE